MSEERLKEIYENIQMQMICEQHCGYKNEYSANLKEKMELYNYIIELKQALNNIKGIIKKFEKQVDKEGNLNAINQYIAYFVNIIEIIDNLGDEK